jgi:hypothetical protein
LRLDPDNAAPSFATDAYESNALMSGLASCRLPLGCFVLAPLPDLVSRRELREYKRTKQSTKQYSLGLRVEF